MINLEWFINSWLYNYNLLLGQLIRIKFEVFLKLYSHHHHLTPLSHPIHILIQIYTLCIEPETKNIGQNFCILHHTWALKY